MTLTIGHGFCTIAFYTTADGPFGLCDPRMFPRLLSDDEIGGLVY
ncbi:MAG TPA: hypothetical protein VGL77_10650 [Armatimonadota bacterium]